MDVLYNLTDYVYSLVDFGRGLLQIVSCHTGYPLSQLLGMHSAIVVHQIIGHGLSEIVLGFMMHDFVVDFSLGSLQLLVRDIVCVV